MAPIIIPWPGAILESVDYVGMAQISPLALTITA